MCSDRRYKQHHNRIWLALEVVARKVRQLNKILTPDSGCNVILLWLARNRGWATPRFLTLKQATEAGGNVRKGEHGTKVYFVKQLQIKNSDDKENETRMVPMMREYMITHAPALRVYAAGLPAASPRSRAASR